MRLVNGDLALLFFSKRFGNNRTLSLWLRANRGPHCGIVFLLVLLLFLVFMTGVSGAKRPLLPSETNVEKSLNLDLIGSWSDDRSDFFPTDIAVIGDHAFLMSRFLVSVVDISDPSEPFGVATIPLTGNNANRILAVDGFIYVTINTTGLHVFDVSDPTNPTQVASWNGNGFESDMALQGHYLYLAGGPGGSGILPGPLLIFNVSNPAVPTLIGSAGSGCEAVAIDDQHAYVTTNFNNYASYFEVFDISDPTNPIGVGSHRFSQNTTRSKGIVLFGDYAYSGGYPGLDIMNVSNPTDPNRQGYLPLQNCRPCEVRGGLLTVARDSLMIMDLTDPRNPVEIAKYEAEGSCGFSLTHGQYIYATDTQEGLLILESPLGSISGTVSSIVDYVENANVEIISSTWPGLLTTTDPVGNYTLLAPDGSQLVRASANGHVDQDTVLTVIRGQTTAANFQLGRILAADTPHPPHSDTFWEWDQDHTISWEVESSEIDSVVVSYRIGVTENWQRIGASPNPTGSLVWPAACIPDSFVVTTQLLYEVYGLDGHLRGKLISPEFALSKPADLLIKSRGYVFTWTDSQPDAERYELQIIPDALSTCGGEAVYGPYVTESPYLLLDPTHLATFPSMSATVFVHAFAEDNTSHLVLTKQITLCDIKSVEGAYFHGNPVILIHGWQSSAGIWQMSGGNEIMTILEDEGFDTWTFDYPHLGDIRRSAWALNECIAYLEEQYPASETDFRLVAHSMGGLVSRAYLQAMAMDIEGNTVFPTTSVTHLVTLGTPHRGSPSMKAWVGSACPGIDSPSRSQLSNEWPFLPRPQSNPFLCQLNSLDDHPFLEEPQCLFMAGQKPAIMSATAALGGITLLPGRNDGAVVDYSATGKGILGIPNHHWTAYCQSHEELYKFTSGLQKSQDLVDFLSSGTVPSTGGCVAKTLKTTVKKVEDGVKTAASGAWAYLKIKGASKKQTDVFPCKFKEDSPTLGLAATADSSGTIVFPFISPGEYLLVVSAHGAIPDSAEIMIPNDGDGWTWNFTLTDDPTYHGPSDPWLTIADGATVTSDSSVTLYCGCTGAQEMIVSEDVFFSDAAWQPTGTAFPWNLGSTEGLHVVFARFRDSTGLESKTVSAAIQLVTSESCELVVTSTPAGAEVLLNGQRTGLFTPAHLNGVIPGNYLVSVTLSGYRPDTEMQELLIVEGELADVDFTLSLRQAPTPFSLLSPTPSQPINTPPLFTWTSSIDPEPGSAVFYSLDISRSPDFAHIDYAFGGTTDTSFAPQLTLSDSTTYNWRIAAETAYGLSSWNQGPGGTFSFDISAPEVTILNPTEGTIWCPGDTVGISWTVNDFSGVDSVQVELRLNPTDSFQLISRLGSQNTGVFWVVPDSIWSADMTCTIRVQALDLAGNQGEGFSSIFSIINPMASSDNSFGPRLSVLGQNTPNPFNPFTKIQYNLPKAGHVTLKIYDVRGGLVRALVDGFQHPGQYEEIWNAEDAIGQKVASGIYFYQLRTEEGIKTRKMCVTK